ncbi:MAG TPA: septum formation initiator family protein [Bryobacteraceae bacterium]
MKPVVFRAGRVAGLLALAVLLFFGLRVPQSIASLKEKHQSIREMQKQNADLEKELADKRERVRKLRDSRTEQEMEIRRQLRYQREGETSIYVPDQKK